jgi:hypothetical protein
MVQFGTWLKDEREHFSANGVDQYELACSPHLMTQHVRTHLLKAGAALASAVSRTPSPTLDVEEAREVWEDEREAFLGTVIDAIHHLSSVLVAVGCSDKELTRRYEIVASRVGPVVASPDSGDDVQEKDEPAETGDTEEETDGTHQDVPRDAEVEEK